MAGAGKTLAVAGDATDWHGGDYAGADVAFHITGTWTGTITFEAKVAGAADAAATPFAMSAAATPGTLVTTATANGLFRSNNGWAGGLMVRARFTTASSGAAVVYPATAGG